MTLIGSSGVTLGNDPEDGMVRRGWMSHERLASELQGHDVLILPSFFDSFGMVVAEAMACGLPAIVTENVGAKEMISPGVNGLVVPTGDAGALADAMRWFILHRDNHCQMRHAARDSAERYDWANYRRRIVEFFMTHCL
jgi:glycosyltransferase involved in cell wall biosynthesis